MSEGAFITTSSTPTARGKNRVQCFRFIQNAFFFFDYRVQKEGRIWLQNRPLRLINFFVRKQTKVDNKDVFQHGRGRTGRW